MATTSNRGAKWDLVIAQATDYAATMAFTAAGVPVNLTGMAFAAELRKTFQGPVIATFTVTVTDAVNGLATLTLPYSVTAALTGNFVWDLKCTDSLGAVSRPLYGVVTCPPDVTT